MNTDPSARTSGPAGGGPASLTTIAAAVAGAILLQACADATGPEGGAVPLRLSLENVPAADAGAMEGYRYGAWVVDAEGTIRLAGTFDPGDDGGATVESPVSSPEHVMVTVEQEADAPPERPAQEKLVGGRLEGDSAALTIDRYLTAGVPLVEEPGSHALFTPSDNPPYPSNETSGIWVFNVEGDTTNGDFHVRMSTLSSGWEYEGWAVRDHGTEDECWLSYGKFRPDARGRLTGLDDLGFGPYSGRIHFMQDPGEVIDYPGGDWVGNPHGYPAPCGLDLPLHLNGDPETGAPSRWTHVVTIEPARHEEDETARSPDEIDPAEREPFFVRPYRNPIGEAPHAEPREIEFYPESLPRGTAVLGGG